MASDPVQHGETAPEAQTVTDVDESAATAGRGAGIMSKAIRGAFWMILSGSGARIIGILGTLAVTRYLTPEEYGEASLAALIIQIAFMVTNGGLAQYIAARPKATNKVIFHVTFYFVLVGILGLLVTLALGDRLGANLHAPGIVKYLPAMGFAAVLDRVATVQDRILLRDLRFRAVGVQRSLGELAYSGVSVGLAAMAAGTPYGGAYALVWATLTRAVLRIITLSWTTPREEWLSPCKLEWETTKEIFSFGIPMAVVALAGYGAQKFDNLVFQYHFGLAWLTFYNLAYNFADMPAALVGEQIGDVLVPSFAHMEDDERRKEALLVAMRMMMLVVTPLAVGLALVAPTLGKLAFDHRYQEGIIKVLQLLSLFSIARTITWVCNSYLQVRNKPRWIMGLEGARMVGIVVIMHSFILVGLMRGKGYAVRWACAAVVLVFFLSAVSYMEAIRRLDRVSVRAQIAPLLSPMVACIPMVAVVVALRRLFTHLGFVAWGAPIVQSVGGQLRTYAPRLLLEITLGALVFVPSAFLLARGATREFLDQTRSALRRRRGGEAAGES